MNQPTSAQYFKPGCTYPKQAVCQIMGVAERWVNENLLKPGQCSHVRKGNQVFFSGECIGEWFARNIQGGPNDIDS